MMDFFAGAGFQHGGIRHLTPKEACVFCRNGAILVDVRESYLNRFKRFDVPEFLLFPFSELKADFERLPAGRPLIFADACGLQSKEALICLLERNWPSPVANLAGGLVEWERDELPLVIDTGERLSGSCMCQLRPREK